MSDIKVGDLVVVVRWPHEHCNSLGHILSIAALAPSSQCRVCGYISTETSAVTEDHWAVPLSWLKRIPPLEELEGQRTEEKLKEPA